MIYVDYEIKGRLMVPEGSEFSDKQDNLIILPNGGTISIHPVVELSSGIDQDDHVNINYEHGRQIGVELQDYERDMEESILEDHTHHVDDILVPVSEEALVEQGIKLQPWVTPKCWIPGEVEPLVVHSYPEGDAADHTDRNWSR